MHACPGPFTAPRNALSYSLPALLPEVEVVVLEVRRQPAVRLEGRAAHSAPLAEVVPVHGDEVALHRVRVGEDLLAEVAAEEALAGVDAHVVAELLPAGEHLAADGAGLSRGKECFFDGIGYA